jgi:hypothetical protein
VEVGDRQLEIRRIVGPTGTHYMIPRRPTPLKINAFLTIEEQDLPAVRALLAALDKEA